MARCRWAASLIGLALIVVAADAPAQAPPLPADRPRPSDDLTFRPTVLVRKGQARGSGTIVASTEGRTLVLTAAHVVDGGGAMAVEIHRFNLGIEGRKLGGEWPKVVPARLVAIDPAGDVALLELNGLAALPYVARLADPLDQAPRTGARVTSIGIDHASELIGWDSHVRGTARLTRSAPDADDQTAAGADAIPEGDDGRVRLFLITADPPVEGRSGGGLYTDDGRLIGLCVGRIKIERRRTGGDGEAAEAAEVGLFASGRSIRDLLIRASDRQNRPDRR